MKNDAKNYPALITVKATGFDQGHTVEINGQRAYYRPYDGSNHEQVAHEAYAALGELIRERLGLPLAVIQEWAEEEA